MERVHVLLISLIFCTQMHAVKTDVEKLLQKKPPLTIAKIETNIQLDTVEKGEDAIIHRTAQNQLLSLSGSIYSCFTHRGPTSLYVRAVKSPYTLESEQYYSTENESPITCIAVHQDEQQVAFGCQDGTAMHINLSAKRTQQHTLSPLRLLALSYAHDGTTVIGLDVRNNATLWNTATDACLRLCANPKLVLSPSLELSNEIVCSTQPAQVTNLPTALKDFLRSRLNDAQQKLLLKIIDMQQSDSVDEDEKTTVVKQIARSSFDEEFKQRMIASLPKAETQSLSFHFILITLLQALIL